MKCPNCNQEIKKSNKFCPNCGEKNLEFKENVIDKNIDKAIDSFQKVNTKITEEVSESEHVKTVVENSKSEFKKLNDFLSIAS